MLRDRNCLPIQWYANKFLAYFPKKSKGKYYNPDYKPTLPLHKTFTPNIGMVSLDITLLDLDIKRVYIRLRHGIPAATFSEGHQPVL